jgi:hypothetical protein
MVPLLVVFFLPRRSLYFISSLFSINGLVVIVLQRIFSFHQIIKRNKLRKAAVAQIPPIVS